MGPLQRLITSAHPRLTLESGLGAQALEGRIRDALTTGQTPCVSISPANANGFDIAVYWEGRTATVDFGGLQHDFDTLDEAIIWALRASSSQYRLRITLIGERPFEWALEELSAHGIARNALRTGSTVWFRSWRSIRTIHRQNHHLSS